MFPIQLYSKIVHETLKGVVAFENKWSVGYAEIDRRLFREPARMKFPEEGARAALKRNALSLSIRRSYRGTYCFLQQSSLVNCASLKKILSHSRSRNIWRSSNVTILHRLLLYSPLSLSLSRDTVVDFAVSILNLIIDRWRKSSNDERGGRTLRYAMARVASVGRGEGRSEKIGEGKGKDANTR